jgi:hypothetical protein
LAIASPQTALEDAAMMEPSKEARRAERFIPVHFIPHHLAVNANQAFEMLGYNDGRSERAKKDAFFRFRAKYEIKTLPGGVFPLWQIEAAIKSEKMWLP